MVARKPKTIKAFAVAQDDDILLDHIEPWTDEGRSDCLRTVNRPAGQRVVTVQIKIVDR